MMENENDPLLYCLLELVKDLDAENIPIILGGGMSLYLFTRIESRLEADVSKYVKAIY